MGEGTKQGVFPSEPQAVRKEFPMFGERYRAATVREPVPFGGFEFFKGARLQRPFKPRDRRKPTTATSDSIPITCGNWKQQAWRLPLRIPTAKRGL